MKLSARNTLKGTVVTSSITDAAVDELARKPGESACAVIRPGDVMIGTD